MNDIVEVSGAKKGPVSVVMAGVHGDEPCGVEAFTEILPTLKINRGKVYFIIANLVALKGGERKVHHDLNRIWGTKPPDSKYGSYEYNRMRYLLPFLRSASALLDIHSSEEATEPFLVAERSSLSLAGSLSVGTKIVTGFGPYCAYSIDNYMHQQGKIGVCLEAGRHDDSASVAVAIEGIEAFLKAREHIASSSQRNFHHDIFEVTELYYFKNDNFKFSRRFRDFDEVEKNDFLGRDFQQPVVVRHEGVILFPNHTVRKMGEEGFYLARRI